MPTAAPSGRFAATCSHRFVGRDANSVTMTLSCDLIRRAARCSYAHKSTSLRDCRTQRMDDITYSVFQSKHPSKKAVSHPVCILSSTSSGIWGSQILCFVFQQILDVLSGNIYPLR
eukprot:4587617-Pleurochrysis_carterae.AAC.1